MTTVFAVMIIGVILSLPIQLIVLVVRAIKKKPLKKFFVGLAICVGSIIPLTLLGALTDPATRCKHDREIISETPATCTEKGKIIEYCSECDINVTVYKDKLPHDYQLSQTIDATCLKKGKLIYRCSVCNDDEIEKTTRISHNYQVVETVEATCTTRGYIKEKCTMCSSTRKTNTDVLGHIMKEVSRIEPTSSSEGEIVSRCERCGNEETEILAKLNNTHTPSDDIEMESVEEVETQKSDEGIVETSITPDYTQEESKESSRKCEPGKRFHFHSQGSTAMSYVIPYCEHPGHIYIAKTFRDTPNDLSYLEAIREHSDSDEIIWGEYYTITATVALADYDVMRTRLNCKVESENIIVIFSVEFRGEFEELVASIDEGDEITFRGRFYDNGCGFTDSELITE